MKYKELGKTGLIVSELCFGALPMGPLQADIPVEEGGQLIKEALERGVNFIDTAELYRTYDHISSALEGFQGEVIIASKSTAEDYQGMEKAIQDALKSLKRDTIEIFHLHAARVTPQVFEERAGAIKCLVDYKEKGYIKAIGISTHNVKVVEKAAEIAEMDVVYPIINKAGRGIVNGTTEEMINAIIKCHNAGKGLYAMKVLAGGNLIGEILDAISFARNLEGLDSISLGMIKKEELELNLKIFENQKITNEMLPKSQITKKLLITGFCVKCGSCLETCPNEALTMGEERAEVDYNKCLLCGYCNPVCPEFAIRMI